MIIVTGGAGFIGSNIIAKLNAKGFDDILLVDNLTNGHKYKNMVRLQISDYMDKDEFWEYIEEDVDFGKVEAIFHDGACTVTTEWDGKYMLENNFTYSKEVFHYAIDNHIPFIYASSASIYGQHTDSAEGNLVTEDPLNVYGYSKLLFDRYVEQTEFKSQVVGLRYFNVYGPGEAHKGSMASVAWHFNNQLKETGEVRLFEGCDGYANGEQMRDFVHVYDVADVNLWFLENPKASGIFNLGTGQAQSFNDVANAVISANGRGKITYVPFPAHLKGHYQSFTQANLTKLRKAGYNGAFMNVEEGVAQYMQWLQHSLAL